MAERALRNHQAIALAGLGQSLRSGYRRPLLSAPTGSGKTEVFCKIACAYLETGKQVLICVPRISLVNQTIERLRLHGMAHVGVIQAQHDLTDPTAPVQVASIATLAARGLDRLPDADVVLVDEAHLVFKFQRDWMADQRWANTRFIGFSATPGTRGLGLLYDALVTSATTQDLIDAGHLVPAKVFAPPSGVLPDLQGVKVVNTEHGRDYATGQLSQRMRAPQLVADVVETRRAMAGDRPTLVFAVDRAHASALHEKFCAAGVHAEYVDAHTPLTERERIRADMEAGRVEVCVNIGCLTTGVDWPFISCIQLCRPTKSAMLYSQIIGRGLRTSPGKDFALILDHTSSTQRLGLVTDIEWTQLDDGNPKPPAAVHECEDAKPVECIECHYLKPPKTPTCPNCGFEMKRISKVATINGSLREVTGKRAPTHADKQAFWSGLITYAAQYCKSEKWRLAQYHQKFGVWPRKLQDVPGPVHEEMRLWIKSRAIAWAKSRGLPDHIARRAA